MCPKNYVNPGRTLIDVLTKAFIYIYFFISLFCYFLSQIGGCGAFIFLSPLDKRVRAIVVRGQKNNGKTNNNDSYTYLHLLDDHIFFIFFFSGTDVV